MLSLIIFIPLLAAVALLFIDRENNALVRMIATGVAGASFLLSLGLLMGFDSSSSAMQFVESAKWVPLFNINYQLGVDGISLLLVILTAFLGVIAIVFSYNQDKLRNFMALMLALEAGTLGVFLALDTILFYVFCISQAFLIILQ